jgi:quinohemoprotein ethanol dehydrogenase
LIAQVLAGFAVALLVAGASRAQEAPAPSSAAAAEPAPGATARPVDDARLQGADAEPGVWLSHGRTTSEQRFSPLERIDERSVSGLGLAWSLDLGTTRGVEATPLFVDGVLYTTAPWSVVYAVDARSGAVLWTWDPQVPRPYGRIACCDVVNRGAAFYRGRLYVGTLDGRLVALDAAKGTPVWEVVTVDQSKAYTITGAPRIVAGKVVIGNGGAEFGVRGYVSAYDAETGEQIWRTYTVPGNPSREFESEALARAAETWSGGAWWKVGGGGTVWDSIVYDPALDLLYVGTGNGSPWSRYARSPGGGDNLYLSSILALRPADGSLVWHYQTTPGDNWDYTATQPMILADLEIDGQERKVLLQAPKNGFFYVLDRTNGELISAEPYVEVTWADGMGEDGRPIEAADLDYREETRAIKPSVLGGHNWHPMSFSPETGLVYLPAQEILGLFRLDPDWSFVRGAWNTGTDFGVYSEVAEEQLLAVSGRLVAWDPVKQAEAWGVDYPTPWNGGTLATAGNLVFQGTADGRFVAYRASDGAPLWESSVGTGIVAGPISYELDGEQYVTVMAGWGGAYALVLGPAARKANVRSAGRMLSYKLGATAVPPPVEPLPSEPPVPGAAVTGSAEVIARGSQLYHQQCTWCHGIQAVGGGAVADLRYATPQVHERWSAIVLGGVYLSKGMPSFADRIDDAGARAIQQYVLSRATAASPPSE